MLRAIQTCVFTAFGTRPVEGLDAEMLFDPFEEQFDLPAEFVEPGNRQSGRSKVVGEKDQPPVGGDVEELDATQRFGVGLGRIESGQQDRLVADQTRRPVHRMGIAARNLKLALARVTNHDRAEWSWYRRPKSRYPRSMM